MHTTRRCIRFLNDGEARSIIISAASLYEGHSHQSDYWSFHLSLFPNNGVSKFSYSILIFPRDPTFPSVMPLNLAHSFPYRDTLHSLI